MKEQIFIINNLISIHGMKEGKVIMKILSKASLLIAFAAIIFSLAAVVTNVYKETNPPIADRTSDINVLLEKDINWKRIVQSTPVKVNTIYLTRENYPRVDGSTATIPMSREFARQLLNMGEEEIRGFVYHNKTHEAYVNLINKDADIIFVSEPSDEELNLAKEMGVEMVLTPVARDAFVFIVNRKNPINNLTLSEIQKIYTAEIKNWKDVGGKNKKIEAFQRAENSGSQTIMEKKVMQGLKMAPPPTFQEDGGMGRLIDSVSEYKNADNSIGYTIYYYVTRLYKSEAVKMIGINGIVCSPETIRNGTYPLSGNIYAVTRKEDDENSGAKLLLEWILSDEGQKCIEQAGYVGIERQD